MSVIWLDERPDKTPHRIVDVVFECDRKPQSAWLAVAVALALHAGLFLWSENIEPSLELWSADIAARVHAELGRQQLVDVLELPKPTKPIARASHVAPKPAAVPEPASAPAQASQIVAQEPGPVDLTGDAFVTGSASKYAGGVTAPQGTSREAVKAVTADRSQPVTLEGHEWQCAWPREADDQQIDEQSVVLRVVVAQDGRVQEVILVSDPGHGFGQAAVACAKRTKFTPALDRDGRATAARSPPIRVRFTR